MTQKNTMAAAMLVAAVPAGALGYFLVSTFLTGLDHAEFTTIFKGLYGVTLAACAGIVFLPFAVLIFGPKATKAKPADEKSSGKKPAKGDADEESKDAAAAESFDESFEPAMGESEIGEPQMGESGVDASETSFEVPISTGELEVVEPSESQDGMSAIDFADESGVNTQTFSTEGIEFDDFIEEEKPAKKKKK